MQTLASFDDVIAEFGGPSKFAEAIGIPAFHAQTMKARGSIPSAYWRKTIHAARERGLDRITDELLIDLAQAKAERDRQSAGAA